MVLFTDVLLVAIIATGLGALFLLCARSARILAGALMPCGVAVLAFMAGYLIADVATGLARAPAGGGAASSSTVTVWGLVAFAVAVAVGWSYTNPGALERWLVRAERADEHADAQTRSHAVRRARRLRWALVVALAVLGPVLWREHRLWRNVEIVRRAPGTTRAFVAMSDLARIGDARAVPVLAQAGGVNELLELGEDGRGEAERLVLEYVRDTSSVDRAGSALDVLCASATWTARFRSGGDPEVRDGIVSALESTAPHVRAAAARCVPHVLDDRERVAASLRPLLSDDVAEVRAVAADGFARAANAASVRPLLSERAVEVRLAAARELARAGDSAATAVLLQVLRDTSASVDLRCQAARAAAETRRPEAQDGLAAASDDKSSGSADGIGSGVASYRWPGLKWGVSGCAAAALETLRP
jgi:hypothetical protein